MKIRIAKSRGRKLGAGFACTVGVKATQAIAFAIAPGPVHVFVHFVGGHDQNSLDRGRASHSVK